MIITQSFIYSSFFFVKPASQRTPLPSLTLQSLTAPKGPWLPLLLLPLCCRVRLNPKRSIIHHPPSSLSFIQPFALVSLSHSHPDRIFFPIRNFLDTVYRLLLYRLHRALALLSSNIRNIRELDAPTHANQTPFSWRKSTCQNPASNYNRSLRTSSIYALSSVPLPHSKYVGPRKHFSSASPGYTCCPLLPVTPSTSVSPLRSLQKTSLFRAAGRPYRQVEYHHTLIQR